jgi:GT2 family glycosyltransferase
MALKEGKRWLLLLDQDTRLPIGFLQAYADAVSRYPEGQLFAPAVEDSVGLLSPFRFVRGSGVRPKGISQRQFELGPYMAVNSGLLIRLDLFHAIGGYDESIPLDFSDMAFLQRAMKITRHLHRADVSLTTHLSEVGSQTSQADSERFHFYCLGARRYSQRTGETFWLFVRSAFRAIRFTIRHHDSIFLQVFFRTWAG